MAVLKMRRICASFPSACASEIMRLIATGRPVVEIMSSTL